MQTITSVLGAIDWTGGSVMWLLGAILFTAGRDFFYMLRIRILTHKKLTWKASFYVIMIWEFASALSPGVVGGAAVAMFILNRESIPFGKATAIVIITAFMDNLFFVVMIPFVFLFIHHSDLFPKGIDSSMPLMWWFWIGCSVIFGITDSSTSSSICPSFKYSSTLVTSFSKAGSIPRRSRFEGV